MRQSLSNFWPRQREDFAPVSRTLYLLKFISFYVIFDVHFAPSTFVSCLRRFSRFRLRFILFRKSRIFQDFFFFFPSVSPPHCGACVFLCGDRGRSLFNVPRGGLSLGALFPHTLSSNPAFSPPSARSRVLSARLRLRCCSTQSRISLAITQKVRKPRCHMSKRVD